MSIVHRFSLLGDSNIRRHVNKNSLRASPCLKACQVIPCGGMEVFSSSLESVRSETNVCILSCVTNFITSSEGPSSIAHRVEPVLQEVRALLHSACAANSSRMYLVSPPMYRTNPLWYREGLPEVLNLFSQVMGQERPENLHLLPSFATPDFDGDGIHLTPYSGLEYILHLFDSSQELLENLNSDVEQVVTKSSEAHRVLEDRVVALEQDHRRLHRVLDHKIAADAEMADFVKNERFEDSFVIEGTPRIPADVFGKAWQVQAVKHVQEVLKLLLGHKGSIVFVQNATTRQPDAIVTYNVKMSTIAESKAIRTKFGSFFLGRKDQRPDALKPYSIKNRVTPETRVRINVLKLMAQRYRDSNPGSLVQVISYDPRPLIKITPAQGADDRRVKVFNYIDAVQSLPTNFSASEVAPIIRRINPRLFGQIKSIFVVLSDDLYQHKSAGPSKPSRPTPRISSSATVTASASEESSNEQDEPEPEVIRPVVPQPSGHKEGPKHGSKGSKGSAERRSQKRGASSDAGSQAKK